MNGSKVIQVKDVIQKYLDETGLTLRAFADALTCGQAPDKDVSLTHATVINWRDGKTAPPTDLLVLILLRWRDWRYDFALECLAAKYPDVWGENRGIWQLAKSLHQDEALVAAE